MKYKNGEYVDAAPRVEAEKAEIKTEREAPPKKKRKKSNPVVTVIVVLLSLAFAAATAGFIYLYGIEETRDREERKARINAELTSFVGMSFGGERFMPDSASFRVKEDSGATEEYSFDFDGGGEAKIESRGELIRFDRKPMSASVEVTKNGDTLFSGTPEQFKSFFPAEDGSCDIKVTADFSNVLADGSAVYSFTAEYKYIPVFKLSADRVAQGDALIVSGTNIRDSAEITVSVPFEYTPRVIRGENSFFAVVPFNCKRETGEFEIKINCGGEETVLPFTVEKTEYDVQYLTVDEETASETIDSSAAVNEYNRVFNEINAHFDENVYWSGRFIWPCEGAITTEYGQQRYTNNRPGSPHYGIDIACAEDTPIFAAGAGKVIYSGELKMSGNTVAIEHGQGLHTVYLHMASRDVKEGDIVEQGTRIGTVGATGFATGPHLHLYTMVGDMAISPTFVLNGTSGIYDIERY